MITTEIKEQYMVDEQDKVFVVTTTIVKQDGNVIGNGKTRKPIAPGDDYSGESLPAKNLCANLHVPTSVARYQAMDALNQAIANAESEQAIAVLQTQLDNAEQAHEQYLADNNP